MNSSTQSALSSSMHVFQKFTAAMPVWTYFLQPIFQSILHWIKKKLKTSKRNILQCHWNFVNGKWLFHFFFTRKFTLINTRNRH